jgi:hypothetical protein
MRAAFYFLNRAVSHSTMSRWRSLLGAALGGLAVGLAPLPPPPRSPSRSTGRLEAYLYSPTPSLVVWPRKNFCSSGDAGHPRSLATTDSKAVTPISRAAQKFQVLIFCSLLDSSVTLSNSFNPGLMLGKRHIAEVNQRSHTPRSVLRSQQTIS